jgi:methylmalonyl-CoA/ethylmalonyl-CoA epimerase
MSISRVDHIAIAVLSIKEASDFYTKALGLAITSIEELPERGIRTAFITIGDLSIELMEPINDSSEISNFLSKRGPGIHHIAFKTNDISDTTVRIKAQGIKVLYNEAQPGAHNTTVNFIYPKDTHGVLIELVQDNKLLK